MSILFTASFLDSLYTETSRRLSQSDITDLEGLFEDLVADAVGAGSSPDAARERALAATIERARETLRLPPET